MTFSTISDPTTSDAGVALGPQPRDEAFVAAIDAVIGEVARETARQPVRNSKSAAAGTVARRANPGTAANRAATSHQPPRWVALVWLAGTLALAGALLAWGLAPSRPNTKPIGEIRLGDRVVAENPGEETDLTFGTDVDPATWRTVELRAEKRTGGGCDISLLRPVSWLKERSVEVGGRVYISVPECGIDDYAHVRSIGPCPSIRSGDGCIVTGRFVHAAADVLDLHVAGLDQPIGTTANHRYWSLDRLEFVCARDFLPGERLQGRRQTLTVAHLEPRLATERVYNIEVQGEHVYQVSAAGILVHNSGPRRCDDFVRTADGEIIELDEIAERVDMNIRGEGVIYRTKGGDATPSGKPYIGSADDLEWRDALSTDGRRRSDADIIDTYLEGDRLDRFTKEYDAVEAAGIENLDNKIHPPHPDNLTR